MEKWKCTLCDYVYDPAAGDPDSGIAPGQLLKIFPMAGYAPGAARQKIHSKKSVDF